MTSSELRGQVVLLMEYYRQQEGELAQQAQQIKQQSDHIKLQQEQIKVQAKQLRELREQVAKLVQAGPSVQPIDGFLHLC